MPASVEHQIIAQKALEVLDFNRQLSKEYFYAHLGLCVVDAVYSINARYTTTQNVVRRYCEHLGLNMIREPLAEKYPEVGSQQPISNFFDSLSCFDPEFLATNIFKNRQRTSTGQSGILKADAVVRFAKTLIINNVEYFQDLTNARNNQLESDIRRIPGQTSGLCLDYFYMLAGDSNQIKPDRMIKRFISSCLDINENRLSMDRAIMLLSGAHQQLMLTHNINLRHFDHLIWNYQRGIETK